MRVPGRVTGRLISVPCKENAKICKHAESQARSSIIGEVVCFVKQHEKKKKKDT